MSIVHPSHKPSLADRVVKNAIQAVLRNSPHACIRDSLPLLLGGSIHLRLDRGRKTNLQIPFVVLPSVFPPPISGTPPRPRRRHHIAAHSSKTNAHGTSFAQLHARRQRWH